MKTKIRTSSIIAGLLLLLNGCASISNPNPYDRCSTYLYDISDINKPLSDIDLGFVHFCKPKLIKMERDGLYSFASSIHFRKEGDPAHRISVSSYSLIQLPTEAFLYSGSTDCRHVTFWTSQDREYFVLISGGCEVYVDKLYGPFVKEGKWKYIKL